MKTTIEFAFELLVLAQAEVMPDPECVFEFLFVESDESEPEPEYPEYEADELWPVESQDERNCRLAEDEAERYSECRM